MDNKNQDDMAMAISEESVFAIPIMRDEFVERVNDRFLHDKVLSEKIAIGCQQVARSVCFIHYWAFTALWISF